LTRIINDKIIARAKEMVTWLFMVQVTRPELVDTNDKDDKENKNVH